MSNLTKIIIVLVILAVIGFAGRSIYFAVSNKTVDEFVDEVKTITEESVEKSLDKADEAVEKALDKTEEKVNQTMDETKEKLQEKLER